jgi:hypothetical protein
VLKFQILSALVRISMHDHFFSFKFLLARFNTLIWRTLQSFENSNKGHPSIISPSNRVLAMKIEPSDRLDHTELQIHVKRFLTRMRID